MTYISHNKHNQLIMSTLGFPANKNFREKCEFFFVFRKLFCEIWLFSKKLIKQKNAKTMRNFVCNYFEEKIPLQQLVVEFSALRAQH